MTTTETPTKAQALGDTLHTSDPAEYLRRVARNVDDAHAALFNSTADEGDLVLFNYDCTNGCDFCGAHVEAWCSYCDAPLIESPNWLMHERGPRWFCECRRGKVFAVAVALDAQLTADLRGRIAQACGDPGSIVKRGDNYREPLSRWTMRAVLTVITPALSAKDATRGE